MPADRDDVRKPADVRAEVDAVTGRMDELERIVRQRALQVQVDVRRRRASKPKAAEA